MLDVVLNRRIEPERDGISRRPELPVLLEGNQIRGARKEQAHLLDRHLRSLCRCHPILTMA